MADRENALGKKTIIAIIAVIVLLFIAGISVGIFLADKGSSEAVDGNQVADVNQNTDANNTNTENQKNDDTVFRTIIALNDEKKTGIGTIILSNIDMKNGTAEVHVKLAVANNRGKGYGTDAVNTIVKYAFNEMRLNCIYAEILEYNQPSIKLFEKCGFKKEGTLCSRIYKGGKYINLMSFSKVKGI